MVRELWLWLRQAGREFWRRPSVIAPLALAAVGLAGSWWLAAKVTPGDSLILRYSIYVGTNWITQSRLVYWVPLVTTAFVVLDVACALIFGRTAVVVRQLWLWSAVAVALGFLWLMWLLYRINS